MATWQAAKEYIVNNYRVEEIDGGALKLLFSLPGDRSQLVFVDRTGPSGAEATWLDFTSPVGRAGEFPVEEALFVLRDLVAGGLTAIGTEFIGVRLTVPLKNLDSNEIEDPLHAVCRVADMLEQKFSGADRF